MNTKYISVRLIQLPVFQKKLIACHGTVFLLFPLI
uniref:Uncharacterized protein n=1 Tax=Octopus bimaculoides TaxID=37653 RepID=A0A0L8FR68_OCTBM